jgi:hypothetical protein
LRARQETREKIYIFSYCDDVFTASDLEALLQETSPMVFFTANREIEARLPVIRRSPGVYVRNTMMSWPSHNKDTKEMGELILFSENFLQVKPIFHVASSYMDYFIRMNPLGSYSVLFGEEKFEGGGEVHIAETIEAWSRLFPKGPTYLVLVGKVVLSLEELPKLFIGSSLQSRVLYTVLDQIDVFSQCPNSQTYKYGDRLLFCTWTQQNSFKVSSLETLKEEQSSKEKNKGKKKSILKDTLKIFDVRISNEEAKQALAIVVFRGLSLTIQARGYTREFSLLEFRTWEQLKLELSLFSKGDQAYIESSFTDYLNNPASILKGEEGFTCRAKKPRYKYKGNVVKTVYDVLKVE